MSYEEFKNQIIRKWGDAELAPDEESIRLKYYLCLRYPGYSPLTASAAAVSKITGIPQTTAHRLCEDGADPKLSVISRLFAVDDKLNPEWLLRGKGEMYKRPEDEIVENPAKYEEIIKDKELNIVRLEARLDTIMQLYEKLLRNKFYTVIQKKMDDELANAFADDRIAAEERWQKMEAKKMQTK